MVAPRVAIGPRSASFAEQAVVQGGGLVVGWDEHPEAVVWLDSQDAQSLGELLSASPSVRFVQLPSAGVEAMASAGLFERFGGDTVWACTKGSYGRPVAEHALALLLAGLRHLPARVGARSWGRPSGTSLIGQSVTVLGGGGIARALLELLTPFDVRATVVRRSPEPVPGAHRTATTDQLLDVLPGSLGVIVALALTPATHHIIDSEAMEAMGPQAWLVNVGRGGHVATDAVIDALDQRLIAGAALDVTDPEPLPDGHPLWGRPDCIITPHTANTFEMAVPLMAERIRTNVSRLSAREQPEGRVDPAAGY
ncbi:MAG: NAD(P)-dependent oxidoreductase [Acidimicrobiales bacterium]